MREWHIVTVALAPSSSCAIGLPKRFERPMTTASAPSSCAPATSSRCMTPDGVQGRSPSRPSASSPALTGVSPSTSLRGVDQAGQLDAVEVVGHRQLAEDPADLVVGVEALDERDDLGARDVGRQREVEALHADLGAGLLLALDVDRRRRVVADEDRRQARALAAVLLA